MLYLYDSNPIFHVFDDIYNIMHSDVIYISKPVILVHFAVPMARPGIWEIRIEGSLSPKTMFDEFFITQGGDPPQWNKCGFPHVVADSSVYNINQTYRLTRIPPYIRFVAIPTGNPGGLTVTLAVPQPGFAPPLALEQKPL